MKATVKILLFLLLSGALLFSLAAAGSRALTVGQAVPLLLRTAGQSLVSAATAAPGDGPDGDKLVMGGTYTLKEGETLSGSLIVMGGMATVETGATVEGDGVVLGGTMTVDGKIEGDLVIVGGLVNLGDSAVIEGDASVISGHIDQSESAVIEGSIIDELELPFIAPGTIPGHLNSPQWSLQAPFSGPLMSGIGLLWDGLWLLLRSFLWAVVAILVVLFVPNPVERVARTAVNQPWVSGGLGFLTTVAAVTILGFLAITIICIPVSFVGLLVLVLGWAYGIIVLGAEVGKRLARMMHREWALPVTAALGTFILTLVVNLLGAVVPCVGWVAPALIGFWGLGAVLLTRFGTREYPEGPALPPASAEASFAPEFAAAPMSPANLDTPENPDWPEA